MANDDHIRRGLITKVHIAKSHLGMSDDDYRAVIARNGGGRTSSKDLTVAQLEAVIVDMQRMGWKDRRPGRYRAPAGHAHARKVHALWGALCRAGVPREPTPAGLRGFVKRMTGVDDPDWLTAVQAGKVIEGLKAWAAREGVELDHG